jgi:anion-transporting  ArsA/GET3 family ATPase
MPRYNKDPKLAAHKMDNLAVAFKFLENADIKVLTKPQNVIETNQTMVLGEFYKNKRQTKSMFNSLKRSDLDVDFGVWYQSHNEGSSSVSSSERWEKRLQFQTWSSERCFACMGSTESKQVSKKYDKQKKRKTVETKTKNKSLFANW